MSPPAIELHVDDPASNVARDYRDAPSPSLPVSRTRVTISDVGGGVTRMVLATSFPSAEAMDQLLAMGMREGLTAAVGQTDDLLAGAPQR